MDKSYEPFNLRFTALKEVSSLVRSKVFQYVLGKGF